MESTLNELKEYLQSIKQKLQNDGAAMDISSVIILKIDIGPMTWLEIEKQFADLIEVAKPLNQIVDAIKSNTQNEASKDAIKKVDKAIEELNKLKNLLKTNASEQTQTVIELVEKIKTKVNADPSNIAEELLELKDEFRKAMLDTFKVTKELTQLMENDYLEAILHIWSAQVAVGSLKTTYPSEADQLKHIFNEIEIKFYSLRKFTRKLLNKIKWRLNSKSNDEEPPEEVVSIEKCDMYTHACTVEDLSEPIQEDKRDIITHLGGLLQAKSSEILEHINRVTEEFNSKYPEDDELKRFVREREIKFVDMIDAIGTVGNKIALDAQNRSADGEELAGFYTIMFFYVLKAKVLTFLDIRLSQLNIHELAPVREEKLDPKKEFMEEISEGSLSEFTSECFQGFSIESMLEDEMREHEYDYLEYL